MYGESLGAKVTFPIMKSAIDPLLVSPDPHIFSLRNSLPFVEPPLSAIRYRKKGIGPSCKKAVVPAYEYDPPHEINFHDSLELYF